MNKYPQPSTWKEANRRQADRAMRSFAAMKSRDVPVLQGPLFVDDDEQVKPQSAADAARRTMVLWAVCLWAEGAAKNEVLTIVENLDLWDHISPVEIRFLQCDDPDTSERCRFGWRLESIWVLLWSLGHIDKLSWPDTMCDVRQLAAIFRPNQSNAAFIADARLRDTAELLDAQDLTLRLHWAIRDAVQNERPIPGNLDWARPSEMLPADMNAAVGVVEQRHYTLNWLLKYLDPKDWDRVYTPT